MIVSSIEASELAAEYKAASEFKKGEYFTWLRTTTPEFEIKLPENGVEQRFLVSAEQTINIIPKDWQITDGGYVVRYQLATDGSPETFLLEESVSRTTLVIPKDFLEFNTAYFLTVSVTNAALEELG